MKGILVQIPEIAAPTEFPLADLRCRLHPPNRFGQALRQSEAVVRLSF